jgi:hypothetical protein
VFARHSIVIPEAVLFSTSIVRVWMPSYPLLVAPTRDQLVPLIAINLGCWESQWTQPELSTGNPDDQPETQVLAESLHSTP